MRKTITVVDYGVGNVGSVVNMLKRVGARVEVASDAEGVGRAEALLLPGVGHFDAGMRLLHERDLVRVLERRVHGAQVPVLGICLGMQMLGEGSDEGARPGLGWIAGRCRKLAPEGGLPVPHMGWSETAGRDPVLFGETGPSPRFYYVHSYHLVCASASDVAATCEYGGEIVTAAVRRGHVFGTQFHPEKSHRFGLGLMTGFARYVGALDEGTLVDASPR
jgi:glutamine amidotransferase